jgi:hypothetical protein
MLCFNVCSVRCRETRGAEVLEKDVAVQRELSRDGRLMIQVESGTVHSLKSTFIYISDMDWRPRTVIDGGLSTRMKLTRVMNQLARLFFILIVVMSLQLEKVGCCPNMSCRSIYCTSCRRRGATSEL